MAELAIPAVFMRGGTSKGLVIHARDLPEERGEWGPLLCGAMGSPDPYGRQLNGMGGGISSLSKVCVIGPPSREDADVDYTFVQVMINEARLDFRSNCGNMSSAVGPFAYDEGLVSAENGTCVVRIHNTNTSKIIRSTFDVENGRARSEGDLSIPGVGASGSPVRLDFLEPGGASTGRLLPTGLTTEWIDVPGHGPIEVSLVDAANAAIFVRAVDVGLTGIELPAELEGNEESLALLEVLRRVASVRMGIAPDAVAAARITSVPFVCLVGASTASTTLSGDVIEPRAADLVARVISNGQPHRALPLTIALCTAVAARLTGSVVASSLGASSAALGSSPLRIAMPSGVLEVDADVAHVGDEWVANSGTFFRTARRLFDGRVWSHLPR
jgi:2-methylaconitate cis-trans-isomerase PrpF